MISWNIGTGGDYTTWGAALAALQAASPLGDDYTLTQISDTAENYSTLASVNLNTHAVVLQNGSPHNGDPTSGYKISNGGDSYGISISVSGAGSLEIKDLNVQFVNSVHRDGFYIGANTGIPDVSIHDCISYAPDATDYGIRFSSGADSPSSDVFLWNNATYGFNEGIIVDMAYTANYVVENCTVWGATNGLAISGGAAASGVVNNCLANTVTGNGVAYVEGNNNASDDDTADDFGSGTGSQINITVGNELVSTSISESTFYKVKSGGVCYNGGTSPTIPGNTAGIRGNARASSIGADEYIAPGGNGSGSGGGLSSAITAAINRGYR